MQNTFFSSFVPLNDDSTREPNSPNGEKSKDHPMGVPDTINKSSSKTDSMLIIISSDSESDGEQPPTASFLRSTSFNTQQNTERACSPILKATELNRATTTNAKPDSTSTANNTIPKKHTAKEHTMRKPKKITMKISTSLFQRSVNSAKRSDAQPREPASQKVASERSIGDVLAQENQSHDDQIITESVAHYPINMKSIPVVMLNDVLPKLNNEQLRQLHSHDYPPSRERDGDITEERMILSEESAKVETSDRESSSSSEFLVSRSNRKNSFSRRPYFDSDSSSSTDTEELDMLISNFNQSQKEKKNTKKKHSGNANHPNKHSTMPPTTNNLDTQHSRNVDSSAHSSEPDSVSQISGASHSISSRTSAVHFSSKKNWQGLSTGSVDGEGSAGNPVAVVLDLTPDSDAVEASVASKTSNNLVSSVSPMQSEASHSTVNENKEVPTTSSVHIECSPRHRNVTSVQQDCTVEAHSNSEKNVAGCSEIEGDPQQGQLPPASDTTTAPTVKVAKAKVSFLQSRSPLSSLTIKKRGRGRPRQKRRGNPNRLPVLQPIIARPNPEQSKSDSTMLQPVLQEKNPGTSKDTAVPSMQPILENKCTEKLRTDGLVLEPVLERLSIANSCTQAGVSANPTRKNKEHDAAYVQLEKLKDNDAKSGHLADWQPNVTLVGVTKRKPSNTRYKISKKTTGPILLRRNAKLPSGLSQSRKSGLSPILTQPARSQKQRTLRKRKPVFYCEDTLSLSPQPHKLLKLSRGKKYKHICVNRHNDLHEIVIAVESANQKFIESKLSKKYNFLFIKTLQELITAFQHSRQNPNCKAVILSSVGPVFCSGIDPVSLLNWAQADKEENDLIELMRIFINTLIRFSKPIIAVVQGPAVGFGATMLLHCDCIYASDRASLQWHFAQIGLPPFGCTTQLLTDTVGICRTRSLLLEGRTISAKLGKDLGIIAEVFPHDSLFANVKPLCFAIRQSSGYALRRAKLLMNTNLVKGLTECNICEIFHLKQCLKIPSCREVLHRYISIHLQCS